MATMTTYHVRPREDGWAVEAEGAKRPSAVEERKADAVERAREIAENQQPAHVIVHKQDGTVQREFSYGDTEATTATGAEQTQAAGRDAAYALAGLANDALQLANEAVKLARQLPERVRDRATEMRDLKARREELEETLRQLRDSAEQRFDEQATKGRTVADDILSDDRVQRVIDQAKNARSQVKAAITSIRKTGDQAASSAFRAGKDQASAASSQVKAAATSVRKTAEAAAGREPDDDA